MRIGNMVIGKVCGLGAVGVCLLALTTGCGINGSAPVNTPTKVSLSMQGNVHGGQQPIYQSTIGLWQAGANSYGKGATNLMTSTIKTGTDGSFNISGDYTACATGSQVYITAYGGDPTGTDDGSINNTAIMLVAALGLCDNINSSTNVSLNEVTTVAAAFGLGQFFGGFGTTGGTGDLIGAPGTNKPGLVNAFATTRNLVSTTTGLPATTTAAANSFWLTANDQQKLNTMANILADCVNQSLSSNAACTSLFSAVTPKYAPMTTATAATAAADTFQAAVYLSLNPTSTNTNTSSTNMATLIGEQSAFQPFAPALSSAPNDWTLALSYSGTGIDNLAEAAVDANGDIWFVNGNASGTNGGGVVILNGGTGTNGGTAGVTGGQIGYYTSGTYTPVTTPVTATVNAPRGIAIDENGNGWTANNATTYYVFKASSGVGITGVFTVGAGPSSLYGVAIDPTSDNVYVNSSGNVVSVAEGATNGSAANVAGSTACSNCIGTASGPGLVFNASSGAYALNNGGTGLYEFTAPNSTTSVTPAAVTSSPFTAGSALYGAAVDGSGRVIATNSSTTLTVISSFASSTTSSITNSCLSSPKLVAIDGNNNIWAANDGTQSVSVNGTSTTGVYTVCEFNSAGTLLSAAVGYGPHNISTGRGIAIDLSGNVWVTSYIAGAPNTGVAGANVTEIIGAAVPVVNPIASAIKYSGTTAYSTAVGNGTLGPLRP